ncbi:hypothetical protein ACJD0Z_07345 [Flavobacteriaceae bacterium M23B6Z8]
MRDKAQERIVFIGTLVVLLSLAIQYALNFEQNFYQFNLFEVFITSIFLIIYAGIHYYNMLSHQKKFVFINAGVLIYLMSSSLLFIGGNLLIKSNREVTKWIWIINAVMYLIYQLLIFVEWKRTYSIRNPQ